MAINFLNTVAFNQNTLEKPRIENQPNDTAAGTGVEGQVYFDTTVDALKIYAGGAWVEVGATSGVETFTNASGTYVAFGTNNTSAIGNVTVGTVDLTAVDGTSTAADRFLTKANKWATIPFGDITEVQGGTYINVTDQTGPVPIVNHDLTSRTDTTSTAAPAYGGTFTAIDTVTTNTTGHITALNVKTVTIPASDNTSYDLTTAPTGTAVRLTGSDSTNDDVTISGTTGQTAMSRISTSELRVALTDDVTIVDDLTVGGVITQSQTGETNSLASKLDMNNNKITEVATGTVSTDAVNLGQVELLVAGVGVFQGGYNATTDPGVPKISGGSNVALDQGDYFVVSHDGDITFSGTTTTGVNSGALANSTALVLTAANTSVAVGMDVTGTGVPPGITILTVTNSTNFVLSSAITIANTTTLTFSDQVVSVEVGDFIFANSAITASSDPAASAYTIVQSDANIAGAGATDGATEKGVAGFDSASFDVSASGWVQLKPQANPYGASVLLNSGSDSGGETTFTVSVTSLFGAGALAANCKAEVVTTSGRQTVYPDITGNGTGSLDFKFIPVVSNGTYTALITIV